VQKQFDMLTTTLATFANRAPFSFDLALCLKMHAHPQTDLRATLIPHTTFAFASYGAELTFSYHADAFREREEQLATSN
jgi:hypothetical protein